MSNATKQSWPWGKILVGVALLLALTVMWKFLPMNEWARAAIDWIDGLGPWGYLAFYGLYVVAALVGVPRTPLNVGAGFIFSFLGALAVVMLASATCNIATFEIARHVARDWVNRRIEKVPNARKIMDAVEREGFKMVFLIRLNPFIPAVIKGYGFGTTNLRLRPYLIASVLGSLPIIAMHIYLGYLGGEAMMSSAEQPEKWRNIILVGGAIVSAIGVAVISWYAHRALHNKHLEPA